VADVATVVQLSPGLLVGALVVAVVLHASAIVEQDTKTTKVLLIGSSFCMIVSFTFDHQNWQMNLKRASFAWFMALRPFAVHWTDSPTQS
jgi:hypothetical protein